MVFFFKLGISFTKCKLIGNTGSSGSRNPCRGSASDIQIAWSTFLSEVYFFEYEQFISSDRNIYIFLRNGNIFLSPRKNIFLQNGKVSFFRMDICLLFRMEIYISSKWKYIFLQNGNMYFFRMEISTYFFGMEIQGSLAAGTRVEGLQVTSRSGGPPFYQMSHTELFISHKICSFFGCVLKSLYLQITSSQPSSHVKSSQRHSGHER